jgi:hypothetical protein
VSAARETIDQRRARLVSRAAAERESIARHLAPLGTLSDGLDRLRGINHRLPTVAVGVGLGLTALLLVLPGGPASLLRRGVALYHLAGSVGRLFSRR